ncbi:MAG: helix-turn-helix transcriptional regulator [Clostridia bacterium]|nr:helix-turn-helix transcriptional regulator [Clostridia bacterium]
MFFKRLRDLREDHDLSQTQVAELLHTNQTVYSRYERGCRTIPVEHLLILADYYNTSLDYLVGRTNNPAPPIK